MTPQVSIIVPVYKVEKYLHSCIDSILMQSYEDFECILVDDCSPDNCPQICDDYAKKDSRIKIIHKKENNGCPQARKTGLEASKGTFILFVDSDDWIECDMLEKMYNKAMTGNYDIVISNCYINSDTSQTDHIKPEVYDKLTIFRHLIMHWYFSPFLVDKLIKRDIYQKTVFPKNHFSEDIVVTIQTVYYAEKIGYLPDCLYHYRQNPESINYSETLANKTIDEYHNFIIILQFLGDKNLIPVLKNEINYRINCIKITYLTDKGLRNFSYTILDNFCPESTDNLLTKKLYMNFFNRLILFLAIKKNPFTFFIIDTHQFLVFTLKKIYRFIIPVNLRSALGSKRFQKIQNRQMNQTA